MNKRIWYWLIAVLAAIVLVLIIWSVSKRPDQPPVGGAGSNAAGSGHAGMDHSNMGGSSQQAGDPNLLGYLDEQDQIMTTMMTEMASIQPSGNASIDFLTGMIPHHEAAVAMAESYLKYGGGHEVLAPLAQDIITVQKEEIGQMDGMMERLKAAGTTDQEKAKAYLDAYDSLMDHSMSHASSDSLDAAFADGMIMHHQMAVDMADAILPYTDDENVAALARAIADAQRQEIADMQAVLDGLN